MVADRELEVLLDEVIACLARTELGDVRGQLARTSPSLLDQLAEAYRPRGGGPGPAAAPTLSGSTGAQLSDDRDWMRDTVLVAKQAYVWLHQLGVSGLDEIPDAALEALASRGISGLWLIGLWERSPASRTIKRRNGNPEAEASAYALRGYRIAERLGGEAALQRLKQRAWERGIRLAADMVPNHMGLDSRWMVEHPDWFLQLSSPPYPGYRFEGPDVSGDPAIEVYLEDGYWTRSDAAVVFKCVERATGRERYVYHGNDGTQMPWNDTAQLDYLQPAVREAVIATIVELARTFPILRFDAAMTLARRHVQRLWYPPPGEGGAIPSRAANSVSVEAFDQQMPREFWREVVERVRDEVPDTLLLAEAFWMMEGYFVRELGMHRVYNSAFMHMLRDEENAAYRSCIKDILAQQPAVLERFVNFMNNPDEDTARAQFGAGEKYFAVATLLATLPGLPMIGHGQIEGFGEKYGMEFSRPTLDEQPDPDFVARHDAEIAPLLRQRSRFSSAADFALYDVVRDDGEVDEDVFAYTNGPVLVVVNNADRATRGRIFASVPVNTGTVEAPVRVCRRLPEPVEISLGPYGRIVRLP